MVISEKTLKKLSDKKIKILLHNNGILITARVYSRITAHTCQGSIAEIIKIIEFLFDLKQTKTFVFT